MNKQIIEGIQTEAGSGNVFADLELPDADTLQIQSGLTVEIAKATRQQGLTQADAAKRLGLTPHQVSRLLHGDFSGFSELELMTCLNRMGYDIEISVRKTSKPIGHLQLTHV